MRIKKIKRKEKSLTQGAMGIGFFINLPHDMRKEIGSYLSDKDLATLESVSKAFHGPVLIPKTNSESYAKNWAKKSFKASFKPTRWLAEAIKESFLYGGDDSAAMGVMIMPLVATPNIVISALAATTGFFCGSVKDIPISIKDHRIRHHGKKFKGEKITFR